METKVGGMAMKLGALFILFFVGTVALDFAFSARDRGETGQTSVQGDIKKTFPVQPGGRLIMDVSPGPIEVKTTGESEIVVEIFRKAERVGAAQAEELLRNHEVTFEHLENNLTIRAKVRNEGWKLWRRSGLNVRYVISLPSEFNVDLKTSGGGISVGDLRGEVRVNTSGGGLRIGKIEGPVTGNTSGGGISLAGCNGKAEIRTSGGGINIGSGAGSITADTSGGSIEIGNYIGDVYIRTSGGGISAESVEGSIDASTSGGPVSVALKGQPKKDCRLSSSGGGITVDIEENMELNIDAEASGGGVTCDLPVTVLGRIDKGRLKGTLNGGGQALVVQTSGGSIHLRKLKR
jgi:Putative adhesin